MFAKPACYEVNQEQCPSFNFLEDSFKNQTVQPIQPFNPLMPIVSKRKILYNVQAWGGHTKFKKWKFFNVQAQEEGTVREHLISKLVFQLGTEEPILFHVISIMILFLFSMFNCWRLWHLSYETNLYNKSD